MTEVTYTEAVSMLQESIDAIGHDFVYKKQDGEDLCLYVHNESGSLEPGCIVGDMLVRQHILTISELYDMQENREDGKSSFDTIKKYIEQETGKSFTTMASDLIYWTQHAQDTGLTWSEALESGMRAVARYGYGENL